MRLRTLLPARAVLGGLAMPAFAQPLTLSFHEFFAQPIGPRGAVLQAAVGREVRLTGFMVRRERPQAGLTPRPVNMAEHADGEADDLPATAVTVVLDEARRDRLVAGHGEARCGPEDHGGPLPDRRQACGCRRGAARLRQRLHEGATQGRGHRDGTRPQRGGRRPP
ncbi:hypothetical protein [Roseateles sp. LKC17W]|uniref:Uncharacterized protein n=1 Tax=Pelomonas margarita TaxID=3299031 RepID=A0ABW7FLC6_9BURK